MSNTERNQRNLMFLNALAVITEGRPEILSTIADAHENDFERAWHSNLSRHLRSSELELQRALKPEAEYEKLWQEKVDIITIHDNNYPRLLKQIHDPPYLLYVKGALNAQQNDCMAVVGARRISPYGKRATEDITRELSRAGFYIVSGMALGIDTVAHKTAIAEQAPTIAVLGSGIDTDSIYPQSHTHIARDIVASGGCVISESPIGFKAMPYSFPQRNRIVSGISRGVVIVEADLKSGSLITAKIALDQNRDVFALPGSIYSATSRGTNWLIKNGATPITTPRDILEHYNLHIKENKENGIRADNPEEAKILKALRYAPKTIDQLTIDNDIDMATLNATLVMMELKNKIKNLGDNTYVINN